MDLKFVPITTDEEEMRPYLGNAFCLEVFHTFKEFYTKVRFQWPWIGFFALENNEVVGVGGYKGSPKNNRIEIGYGVIPENEGRGYATLICKHLVSYALEHDPNLRITARTLMEVNPPTSIQKKNGFKYMGIVNDPDDGDVWEWEYSKLQ